MRVLKAILAAPILPILVIGGLLFSPIITGDFGSSGFGTLRLQLIYFAILAPLCAYGIVIIFGLPAFLILKRLGKANLLSALLVGAFLGAMLVLGPELSRVLTSFDSGTLSTFSGGCQSITDNVRTTCGYLQLFQSAAGFAGLGALAGVCFWMVYAHSEKISLAFVGGVIGALVFATIAFAIFTKDRSCHNFSQYEKLSYSPWIAVELKIEESEWPELTKIIRSHAETFDLSFRNSSHADEGTVNILGLSVCDGKGYMVSVNEQRWKTSTSRGRYQRTTVGVSFMEVIEGEQNIDLAEKLIADLERQWPDRLFYSGPSGEILEAEPGEILFRDDFRED